MFPHVNLNYLIDNEEKYTSYMGMLGFLPFPFCLRWWILRIKVLYFFHIALHCINIQFRVDYKSSPFSSVFSNWPNAITNSTVDLARAQSRYSLLNCGFWWGPTQHDNNLTHYILHLLHIKFYISTKFWDRILHVTFSAFHAWLMLQKYPQNMPHTRHGTSLEN